MEIEVELEDDFPQLPVCLYCPYFQLSSPPSSMAYGNDEVVTTTSGILSQRRIEMTLLNIQHCLRESVKYSYKKKYIYIYIFVLFFFFMVMNAFTTINKLYHF